MGGQEGTPPSVSCDAETAELERGDDSDAGAGAGAPSHELLLKWVLDINPRLETIISSEFRPVQNHKKTKNFLCIILIFPNSEILFDFNEGSSRVFKDHLMF